MNCDLAFDYLTDAELVNSPELQAHLASCPRCRQMRQTLEPALDLLTTPEPFGNSHSECRATATQPYLSLEAVQAAETAARQLGRGRPAHFRRRALSVAKSAALLVIGGAMSAALVIPRTHSPAASTAGSTTNGGECLWTADHGVPSNRDARSVILSCVACHLEAVR